MIKALVWMFKILLLPFYFLFGLLATLLKLMHR